MKMTGSSIRTEGAETPTPAPRTVRVCVCVVEDDNVVREQLVHQLSRAPGFTCVSSHRSAEAALEEIPRHSPDVVLMDINLPKMSGVDCVRHLKGQLPRTQYVMLTVYEDADLIFKSLLAGAVGYLLKGRTAGSGTQVLEAVRDAANGGSPLNSLIARKIVQHFHHQPSRPGTEQPLSSREREVLELLSKGLPYKEIADMLGVGIETVRKHCHNIYEKLQVGSRTEAVVKYLGK
ncbi:MAG TPA: response regulator transcription factor [Verrucomicrobiae bacterium]|jgi:DNA-binding NarL/FixJ family response regulator|nr:response regulator transcription factor [Verrucomicrobiae bacterium]